MLNAEIIAIGSEMLTPFRLDTNSLWLTERLNSMGIDVKLKTIVGDDEARLEETIRDAMKRSEIVIATGGLADRGRHYAEDLRSSIETAIDPGRRDNRKDQSSIRPPKYAYA